MREIRILISQPNMFSEQVFLPYFYCNLKSYCNRHAEIAENCTWLDPIFIAQDADAALRPYESAPPQILGLSCYEWNWDLQMEIAEKVRARYPDCLIIAGGPHVDMRDARIFQNTVLDVTVIKDGELAFLRILKKMLNGSRDFQDIPGLTLPHDGRSACLKTGEPELVSCFDWEPYLIESEYLRQIVKKNGRTIALWETNRGCPYHCTFCDWGSNTYSKVRQFPLERLVREVEWFGESKIEIVMIADANFGMLQRDVVLADLLVQMKKRFGYPKFVYFSASKSHWQRNFEIAKKLFDADMLASYTLAIQHTSESVLRAIGRKNLPERAQHQLCEGLLGSGVPVIPQFILGNPGDTPALWKRALTDVMEWGLHEEHRSQCFAVLPNAPAADPEYLAKWEGKLIKRFTSYRTVRRKRDFRPLSRSTYLIACKTYDESDWIDMYLFETLVKALHNGAITRFISIYLRECHGVPYLDFYSALHTHLINNPKSSLGRCYLALRNHLSAFLTNPSAVEDMALDELPNFPWLVQPEEWLFFQFVFNSRVSGDELQQHMEYAYGALSDRLKSISQFQKELLILPGYDRRRGKAITLLHDWPGFFRRIESGRKETPMTEPEEFSESKVLRFRDQFCGPLSLYALNWNECPSQSVEETWASWFQTVVGSTHHRGKRTYHRDYE